MKFKLRVAMATIALLFALVAFCAFARQSLMAASTELTEAPEGLPPVERVLLNDTTFALDGTKRLVAHSEDTDDSLRLYAVHIYRTGEQARRGYGIYLGKGIVITAAHVAGLGIWRRPQVEVAGQELTTEV